MQINNLTLHSKGRCAIRTRSASELEGRLRDEMKRSGYWNWLIMMAMLLLVDGFAAEAGPPFSPHGIVERDVRSGKSRLVVKSQGNPIKFQVYELWRYDPESRRWSLAEFKTLNKVIALGLVTELPDKAGLYWLKWKEDERLFASLVFTGPVLCNDIDLRPSPQADVVATCVPFEASANAAYVPDPNIYCKR